MSEIDKLFQDLNIIKKIQKKLPTLFQLSEIDNQRNGKLGMEIGSARENYNSIINISIWRRKYNNKYIHWRK